MFIRNWLRSSKTRFLPCSIKASNLAVNLAMRSRRSSNPKLTLGSVSATDGPTGAIDCRLTLAENDASEMAAMIVFLNCDVIKNLISSIIWKRCSRPGEGSYRLASGGKWQSSRLCSRDSRGFELAAQRVYQGLADLLRRRCLADADAKWITCKHFKLLPALCDKRLMRCFSAMIF